MDAGQQHRRRRQPGRHLRRRPPRRRGPRGRRAAAGACSATTTSRCSSASPAPPWSTPPTPGPSTWLGHRGRALRRARPTTSPPTAAPGWCTSPPPSAPTTCRSPAATACPSSTRCAPTAPSRRTCRWSAGCSSRPPTAPLADDLSARGLLFRETPYEHSYPHCWRCDTALLYYALPVLVHPHDRHQGPAGRGERADRPGTRRPSSTAATATGWTTTSTGRSRATATGARPCRSGAAPRTAPTGRSSARSPSSARRPGATLSDLDPHRPFVDDVVVPCVQRVRGDRGAEPGARGHRRLVRLGGDAVRPGRLPAQRRRAGLPGAVHRRGDRPDPRLVLHADDRRHAGVRPQLLRDGAVPRATSSTATAAR